jgi:WD40 repeat protein
MQLWDLTERNSHTFFAKWNYIWVSSSNLPVVTWSKMANKQSVGRTRLLPELCQYAGAILCPERTNIYLVLNSNPSTVNCWNCSKYIKNCQKSTGFNYSVKSEAFQPLSTIPVTTNLSDSRTFRLDVWSKVTFDAAHVDKTYKRKLFPKNCLFLGKSVVWTLYFWGET